MIGAALFILYDFNKAPHENDGPDDIIVSEVELSKYMQYRQRAFNQAMSFSQLAKLSKNELQLLIDGYVRQQALYREAISLGLDQEDDVIKQRLIQKIEFLVRGFIGSELTVTQRDIERYYQSNSDRYTEPASISFYHIYFDSRAMSMTEAQKRITSILQQLKSSQLTPHQVRDKGDRFIYFKNYVGKTEEFIASHFGQAFSDQVFRLQESKKWYGPIRSDHGEHIIWISAKQTQTVPSLDVVYDRVMDDVRAHQINTAVEKEIQKIIAKHTIDQRYVTAQPER